MFCVKNTVGGLPVRSLFEKNTLILDHPWDKIIRDLKRSGSISQSIYRKQVAPLETKVKRKIWLIFYPINDGRIKISIPQRSVFVKSGF